MSLNIDDTSPNLSDMFLAMNDKHNNLWFVADTASPKSLVPLHTFPNLSTQHSPCVLLTANDRPIQQIGVLDLILQFTKFRNRHVTLPLECESYPVFSFSCLKGHSGENFWKYFIFEKNFIIFKKFSVLVSKFETQGK